MVEVLAMVEWVGVAADAAATLCQVAMAGRAEGVAVVRGVMTGVA